jgi:prolyl-tRNA synthetase
MADGGYFTDKFSDEFQTVSPIGEDTIYIDEEKRIAVNKEVYTDETLEKLGLDKSKLVEKRAVEVGNIFPLESKYSDALDLYYTDENGQKQSIVMGCYGIGISRLVGMIAEHFSDEKGLVWPENVAPFRVYLVSIGDVAKEAEKLYEDLQKAGVSVLYDDRDARPGEKFSDADLIGIPHRVVISEKLLKEDKLEYKARTSDTAEFLTQKQLLDRLV